MVHRTLVRCQAAILARPWRVLAVCAAFVAVALALGSAVEFRTSRSELAPEDDPEEQRFRRIVGEFAGTSDLILCVEAAPGASKTPEDLRAFADVLAGEIRRDPEVARVFHRVDLDWFLDHALYLAPPSAVRAALDAADQESAFLARIPQIRNLADLNGEIAARLEEGLRQAAAPPGGEEAGEGIAHLAALLRWERRFLEEPDSILPDLESAPPLLALAGDRPGPASRGYLATRDGRTLFLLVSPRSDDDSLSALRRLVEAARRRAEEVSAARPGFRVALTGEPATTVEEMDVVRRDTLFTALVSAAGVAILTLLVFRWKSHSWLVLGALGAGVAWAFGAVRLELGYLNLITSSFISTLVGVGVAYGIHPVSEYELEGAHTIDPLEAVRGAYHATGAAVTVGAITTSAAFFSILLMDFRGFAELGLVAGVGVILCLVAAMTILPALLLVYGRWRHRHDREARHGAASAAVDRLWVDRGAGLVCRFPRTVTALSVAVTALAGWAAFGVRFDANILELLPSGAESVRYQNRMIMESDLSPIFNIVVARDLERLRAFRERAGAEPTIERFESILEFLPEDPGRSRALARQIGALAEKIRLPETARPAESAELAASLRRVEEALAEAAEAAFGAGMGRTAGALEEARAEADGAARFVLAAPESSVAAWSDGQRRLLEWARRALADLRRAAQVEPPAADDLPPEVRQRFVSSSGRFLAFLHPKGRVFDPVFLERFVEASRRVSRGASGFPIVFHRMSHRITSGFGEAAAAAAVLVLLILLIDYRNLREALLALLPLAMGLVWMLGGMRLMGLSFNFANLVTVPLIIGVGIDNGVHVIHRVRLEGAGGMDIVLRHTGRAIVIASLTTMIGFGSLALASHRGLASLGIVLLWGVGACLVASTVVLPNILVAFKQVKR